MPPATLELTFAITALRVAAEVEARGGGVLASLAACAAGQATVHATIEFRPR